DVKPDIIHAHSPVLNALAALKVGKAFKIPVVYEVRAFWEDAAVDHGTSVEGGLRYKLTHALETYALKKADAVTTICEGLRNDIITRGIDKEKITVIPNAVDIEKFTIQNSSDRVLVSRLGLEGKNVLGFIGSFYAYEGLPLLLESLAMILEDEPETHLVLVGGGPQEKELKKLVGKLGLEEKVVFTGRVPHNEIQSYYSLIDMFVYPRISMRLTELVTPLKPLEAMAQGKIVVASDVGGHRELIRPGENGELFPAGDVAELAKTVVELFRQRENWGKRQAESRQFVEQERTWKKSVALYGGTYARLTGILSE
ncbi:MAG: glycosyltransferase, exosortase A system-associated, partial [Gammaproteobacteria bacterium]|nr:glycosyltransferase, exosortase A system-associated [Gammaproteobacteria bacterium]